MAGITLGLLFLSTALLAAVRGDCPSYAQTENDCITKSQFSTVAGKDPKQDPNRYCEQGAIYAAVAQNCLRDCKFNEQNSDFLTLKNKVNTFCSQNNANCSKVADTYVSQTRCFDNPFYKPGSNLKSVISDIVKQFEAKVPNIDCNLLYWGRTCQWNQSCSINQNLDIQLIIDNPEIALGLAICGSETLQGFLPYLEALGPQCNSDLYAKIESKCGIACDIADATDCQPVCALLEKQLQCFEDNIVNCTAAERRYVLPRLNTYALANRYMGCSLKYNGLTIRSPGADKEYSTLINQCWWTDTYEDAMSCYRLLPLLNRDTPIKDFCRTKSDSETQITNCRIAFRGVTTPQARLLMRAQDLLLDLKPNFAPGLGAYSVDSYGMAQTYNSTPDSCPNSLRWTTRICLPLSERVSSTAANAPTTPRNTNTPANTPVKGEGETKRPGNSVDDGQNYEHTNSAGSTVPAALMIITSALYTLMY